MPRLASNCAITDIKTFYRDDPPVLWCSFLELPENVLETILDYIQKTRTLLALRLTCRRLWNELKKDKYWIGKTVILHKYIQPEISTKRYILQCIFRKHICTTSAWLITFVEDDRNWNCTTESSTVLLDILTRKWISYICRIIDQYVNRNEHTSMCNIEISDIIDTHERIQTAIASYSNHNTPKLLTRGTVSNKIEPETTLSMSRSDALVDNVMTDKTKRDPSLRSTTRKRKTSPSCTIYNISPTKRYCRERVAT